MQRSLKEAYQLKQLRSLQEHIRTVDKQLLIEHQTSKLIVEAMDDEDLNKASQIIDKLRNIKGQGLKHLDDAISEAEAELNKYTGGGPLTKAWTKLKSKVGVDNPLVKIMTFANALEAGFKQLPVIIKNNVGKLEPEHQDKTLAELVTDPAKKEILVKNMLKALSPKGIFGVFKKVPYTKTDLLVNDLMTVKLTSLNAVTKQVMSGPLSDQIASDIKSAVTGQGEAETKGTEASGTTTGTQPSTSTSSAKGTTKSTETTPPGEAPARQSAKTIIDRVKPALEDLGIKDVNRVIDVLDDLGVLKTS